MLNTIRKLFVEVQEDVDTEIKLWHRKNALTPDMWFLEQFEYQLIFIPDDMKTGKSNHSLITDAAYDGAPIHPGCYTLDHYTFWKKDLGEHSFAIPLDGTFIPQGWLRIAPCPARIQGELYAVRPKQFLKLDEHRHNGVQFQRRRVNISLPYRQVRYNHKKPNPFISEDCLHTVRAWMYVGCEDYWSDQIGDMFSIRECNHYEHDTPKVWIDKFYKFE